jgi:thioester reductase-like protein
MDVFLTGVTGFLGGEVLMDLSKRKEVDKIYCLVRARSEEDAGKRLQKVFSLHDDYMDESKIIPVLGDLADKSLEDILRQNKNLDHVEIIIHSAANTSFSKMFDSMIMDVNVHGLRRILSWSKGLKNLKTFVYVGTATICGKNIRNRAVLEDESPNLETDHLVSYTRSKMMGELMLSEYLREDQILVVRPSIIMGDSRNGTPRSNVILWALATMNLLRLVPVNPESRLDVIPVDFASRAIVKLLFAKRKYKVYHISSGNAGATNMSKLAATLSPVFNHRPPFKFVDKSQLKPMVNWAKNRAGGTLEEPAASPDHHDYWTRILDPKGKLRILLFALEPYLSFIELGQVFDNTRLMEDGGIGQPPPAHEYLLNNIQHFGKIDVFEGAEDF